MSAFDKWEPGMGDLDAAWAEAEDALPEGWMLDRVEIYDDGSGRWAAWAVGNDDNELGSGPTPAAALRALAAKLREMAG